MSFNCQNMLWGLPRIKQGHDHRVRSSTVCAVKRSIWRGFPNSIEIWACPYRIPDLASYSVWLVTEVCDAATPAFSDQWIYCFCCKHSWRNQTSPKPASISDVQRPSRANTQATFRRLLPAIQRNFLGQVQLCLNKGQHSMPVANPNGECCWRGRDHLGATPPKTKRARVVSSEESSYSRTADCAC